MKAIILAAGRGSRMGEQTDILPKCLAKLWGRTLLEWQLKAIREAGIEDIAIVTGYRAEEIQKRQPNLSYFHNEIWVETNMVATLMKAGKWLEAEPCIVSYADIVYEAGAVTSLFQTQTGVSITYYTKFRSLWGERFEHPLEDIETFRLDKDSCLKDIGQKASSFDEIEGQYMGLLKFMPEGWQDVKRMIKNHLPKPVEKMDMTGLLSHLLSEGMKIEAVPYDGLWLEVDSQEDLALYESWEGKGWRKRLQGKRSDTLTVQ